MLKTLFTIFTSFFIGTTNVVSPLSVFVPSPTPTPIITVNLGLVGDLGLGRHITSTARTKNNFNWSFEKISPWLLQNDLNLANLESPIISDCPPGLTGTFTFCGDQRFIPYLFQNKFIFNLNNNHILNYGEKGLKQTEIFLNTDYFYDDFYIKKVNNISFGFLGFDLITYPKYNQKTIIDLVKQYDSQVDWLIVSLHWGNEYLPAAESWRFDLAHRLIDSGADIIHGHHPHVWQGVEDYRGKKIYYSFGNFIFDQNWSYETSHSNIVRLTLSKDQVIKQETFPIEIKFNSQPWLISPTPLQAS